MAKLEFDELRRYTTEEYLLADLKAGFGIKHGKTRVEMTNLEALYYRGFKYDMFNDIYFHPIHKIKVSPNLIREHKNLWQDIDVLIHKSQIKE
jgi:hypothetical protein